MIKKGGQKPEAGGWKPEDLRFFTSDFGLLTSLN